MYTQECGDCKIWYDEHLDDFTFEYEGDEVLRSFNEKEVNEMFLDFGGILREEKNFDGESQ